MTVPVDASTLAPLLGRFMGDSGLDVASVRTSPLRRGTSGSHLSRVVVRVSGRTDPVRLVLKLDRPGELNEVRFYAHLAGRLPVATPRVVAAHELDDGRGWLLMEELPTAKPARAWTADDVRAVVRDMATLHAAHWGDPRLADELPWLGRPDAASLDAEAAALHTSLAVIEAAGLPDLLPELIAASRLRRIARVLDRSRELLGPLLAAGTTVVHGDYWVHNVQLLPDGRRVLLDWQGCRLFSGLWEIVYFLDLWHVLGRRSFRERDPAAEAGIVAVYSEALRERGVALGGSELGEALACARLWHPLAHWLPRYGRLADRALHLPAWRVARRAPAAARLLARAVASRGALRFLAATWARFEQEADRRFPA
jgi:hypothetical protein